jgi:hypothetical protein
MLGHRRWRALLVPLLLLALAAPLDGAVHLYNGRFSPLNDAHVFRAGREGMFRSHPEVGSGPALRITALTFVRCAVQRARHRERAVKHTAL